MHMAPPLPYPRPGMTATDGMGNRRGYGTDQESQERTQGGDDGGVLCGGPSLHGLQHQRTNEPPAESGPGRNDGALGRPASQPGWSAPESLTVQSGVHLSNGGLYMGGVNVRQTVLAIEVACDLAENTRGECEAGVRLLGLTPPQRNGSHSVTQLPSDIPHAGAHGHLKPALEHLIVFPVIQPALMQDLGDGE